MLVAVGAQRVVIRHPDTRGVAIVNANAVTAHAKRGWLVVDSDTPKPVVLEAAEKLGVQVDPSATRAAIIEDLVPVTDDTDDNGGDEPQED